MVGSVFWFVWATGTAGLLRIWAEDLLIVAHSPAIWTTSHLRDIFYLSYTRVIGIARFSVALPSNVLVCQQIHCLSLAQQVLNCKFLLWPDAHYRIESVKRNGAAVHLSGLAPFS